MSDISPSPVKIKNLRKRMLRLPLGDWKRQTKTVHVATPPRGKGGAGMMTVTAEARGRTRVSVDRQLIIPAQQTIDKLPGGDSIPASIRSVKSIKAAIERRDIRIIEG